MYFATFGQFSQKRFALTIFYFFAYSCFGMILFHYQEMDFIENQSKKSFSMSERSGLAHFPIIILSILFSSNGVLPKYIAAYIFLVLRLYLINGASYDQHCMKHIVSHIWPNLYLISLLINISCELSQIMTRCYFQDAIVE